ncbi:MAG: ATP-binding protein [Methanobrevibacter sp.]|jgi:DNA-binding Lrp family transcriptional regulator|nr:ATP-binding protein [Candidatus Methanovirga basalitermitum]
MIRKLPVGMQTFSEIREEGYVYIDKTRQIHDLINEGKIYFLSRPRRFGKSLLLNTIEEVFKGKKELFKGLFIYDKWKWEEKYPVIHVDFSEISHETPETLKESLIEFIQGKSEEFDVALNKHFISPMFAELIKKLNEKTGQKVVILIDEYDLPIIDNLFNNEVLKDNEKVLRSFYRVLKSNDEYVRFVFITGISKFAHVSVFSTLNNTDDITLISEYNSICGYTQEELEDNFKDHIKKLSIKLKLTPEEAMERIKHYYNGYTWNGEEKVYNPYSTLLCLKHAKFSKNWFNTGTPNLLADYPMREFDLKSVSEPLRVSEGKFENSTVENISDEVLLFQTGYLTVKRIEEIEDMVFYDLKVPNFEVESALFENLVDLHSKIPIDEIIEYRKKFMGYVLSGDCDGIRETLSDYLSPIPNTLRGRDERYYHALIFRSLLNTGLKVQSEVHTYNGNIDMIIKEKDHVIIIEFKQSNDESIESMIKKASAQIKEKEYTRPYKNKNLIELILVFKGKEIGCKIRGCKKVWSFFDF